MKAKFEKVYETKEIMLGAKEVEEYVSPVSPRDIRDRHVWGIMQSFHKNKGVEGVIAVNVLEAEKKIEVIDGNHRICAIRKWLVRFPEDRIRATFHVYRNLSQEEKKNLYMILQNSVNQTKTDVLKTQCYDSFLYKAFFSPSEKKSFPCAVTLNENVARNCIKFFRLFEPYYNRNGKAVNTIRRNDLPAIVNSMNKSDLEKMAQYMTDFILIFGEPHIELNRLYSTMEFHMGYMKVYWQGVNCLGRAQFIATMKRNYSQIRGKIETEIASARHASESAQNTYTTILDALKDLNEF